MRIVFMGSPAFAVPSLLRLAEEHEILAVYSQPPRPAGRGKKPRPTAVQAEAEALGVPVRIPAQLKDAAEQEAFAALAADVGVVAAYGLILPPQVLAAPRHGCLNIHASLLPRWRGAAPIHRAILAGDAETGICIMEMEPGLDTGPVLAEARLPIGAEETTGTLEVKLAKLGADLVAETLARLPLSGRPQPQEGATYAKKIDKAEARVDWRRPARDVDRQIRGLSPAPGAWSESETGRLKLLGSRIADGSGAPGTVLGGTRVACGTGAVELTVLQRAGKAPSTAAEFLRGTSLVPGSRLR
ncbi:MAG: methionyl-tRNA formyltransferase [Pseudomonadota bacterium]